MKTGSKEKIEKTMNFEKQFDEKFSGVCFEYLSNDPNYMDKTEKHHFADNDIKEFIRQVISQSIEEERKFLIDKLKKQRDKISYRYYEMSEDMGGDDFLKTLDDLLSEINKGEK